jgi:hypothetical protein
LFSLSPENFKTADILSNKKTSFRNHIHYYLDMNKMHWSKLGIDLLLGAKIDRFMTSTEAMFLPDYLEKGFDSSSQSGIPLVQEKNLLFQKRDLEQQNNTVFTPSFTFWLLLILGLLFTFISFKGSVILITLFDFLLFLFSGLLGILFVFMWTGTDHRDCSENYNLLWAIPTHVVAAFLIRKNSGIVKKYFLITAILSAIVLVSWIFLPQKLNPALIPIVLLIGIRAWKISTGGKKLIT